MNKDQPIKKLYDLAQLDIDAAYAYDQALKFIDQEEVHHTISAFRQDHIRHAETLSNLIMSLDGVPPENKKDLKGYLIEGMTLIRSIAGTEGALKAMRAIEETTNKQYRDALDFEFTDEIKAVIKKHYDDNKKHLAYVLLTLETFEKV